MAAFNPYRQFGQNVPLSRFLSPFAHERSPPSFCRRPCCAVLRDGKQVSVADYLRVYKPLTEAGLPFR